MKKLIKLLISDKKLTERRNRIMRSTFQIPDDVQLSGQLEISGKKFRCAEGCRFLGQIEIAGGVYIGRFTTINGPNTDILSAVNPINIGSFCSIARNVSFQEYNHRFDRPSSYFMNHNIFGGHMNDDIDSKGSIELGNDVWVGAHCVILSGVKIGHGAIVAANSVVNKDVPNYAIVGGSPAQILGYRFSVEKQSELLNMAWWDWDIDKIRSEKGFFNHKFEPT